MTQQEDIPSPSGEEQELEIEVNGEWKNIYPKPKPKRGADGLKEGNYAIIEKEFATAKEIESKQYDKPYYKATVTYKGEEGVSFFMNGTEAEAFDATGGLDEPIKVFWYKTSVPVNGNELLIKRLGFERVEE